MALQFWRSKGPKPLSPQLHEVIVSRFNIEAAKATSLAYFQRSGNYAGRSVTYVRVIDASLLDGYGVSIKKYEDLEGHTEAILFDGRIEKDGMVDLTDRRGSN